MSLSDAVSMFLAVLEMKQGENGWEPVSLTPKEWERETGVPQEMQILVRQRLMRSGRLRLSVENDRWAYSLADRRS